MSGSFKRVLSGAVGVGLLALASPARALPAGTLVITDQQVDLKSSNLDKALKKAQKGVLVKDGEGWHLYFVAYLNKPAGADEVNLVFYDQKKPDDPKKKLEPVCAQPIQTKANARIISADAMLGAEQNLKPGKYNVLVARIINGKEVVYARTTLELK